MGKYEFVPSFHADTVLTSPIGPHNLGYNHTTKHPIFSWVYHAFATGENLYTKLFDPVETDFITDYDFILDNPLEDAIKLVERFPMPLADLKLERGRCGNNRFYAGDNKTEYRWELDESNELSLSRDGVTGPILKLDVAEHEVFARDYAEYLMGNEDLFAYRTRGRGIIRELQMATVPS